MKRERKKQKSKKRIILLSIFIFLIIIGIPTLISLTSRDIKGTNKIVATKKEETSETKYKIIMKDYLIEKATKEIKFETKEEAQREYDIYIKINEYERRNFGLEVKGKKLIITMDQTQVLQDVGYNEMEDLIIMYTDDGEKIETVSQDKLKECIQNQDYTIK